MWGGFWPAADSKQNQGWKWTFAWCAILFGLLLPLVYFFVPETAYNRQPLAGHDTEADTNPTPTEGEPNEKQDGTTQSEEQAEQTEQAEQQESATQSAERAEAQTEPKKTYRQTLHIFSGTYTTTPFWKIFCRPLVVFWYPAIFWAFLMYGATLTWIVVFSVVNAQIFSAPPYNFSVSQTGLISLSPFIFTLIGELTAGPLSDWLCLKLAQRNHGIYEPEFRLPLLILPLIVGAAGFYGFGVTVHYETHWSGPVLCFGLANMALALMNPCVFGYVLDAHGDLSEEGERRFA